MVRVIEPVSEVRFDTVKIAVALVLRIGMVPKSCVIGERVGPCKGRPTPVRATV